MRRKVLTKVWSPALACLFPGYPAWHEDVFWFSSLKISTPKMVPISLILMTTSVESMEIMHVVFQDVVSTPGMMHHYLKDLQPQS